MKIERVWAYIFSGIEYQEYQGVSDVPKVESLPKNHHEVYHSVPHLFEIQ